MGWMQAKGICKQNPEANIWHKRGENGEWRRLHNVELHCLYRWANILVDLRDHYLLSAICWLFINSWNSIHKFTADYSLTLEIQLINLLLIIHQLLKFNSWIYCWLFINSWNSIHEFTCRDSFKIRVIKSRRLRWADHVARMEEDRNAFKILTNKPTRRRPLRKSKLRWEDNIKMDLKGVGINTRNWDDSAPKKRDYWRALVNAALNLRFP